MDITLFALNSSFTHTNLAIRYLASALEAEGLTAVIKEYNLKDKKAKVLNELVNTHSDIYAFSVYIWNINAMLSYARDLKKLRPHSYIVFGGPEVSFENDSFFTEHPYIDMIIRGEGESVIAEVCKEPSRYKIVDGNHTDSFAHAGILYDRYPAQGDILYYESARGCPYRCSYCLSSLSEGLRRKDTEQVLNELSQFEKLNNKPRIIKFVDRTFNYDLQRAKEIWKALLSDKYSLNYHFEIAADLLDDECFKILADMPMGKIQFEAGIQSTNMNTLNEIKRKTDSNKVIKTLTRLKSFGNIHIHADLIAGLPFEDINSFATSFDEAIACCNKLQLGFLKMLKGSYIRNNAADHGYIYESDPPYTVLSNNYLSYNEVYRLEQIAQTIDRFYSSGRFDNTMEYVLNNVASPFEFFSRLTDIQIKEQDKMSQHECRMALISMLDNDPVALSRLALDSIIYENKKPPQELKEYYTEHSRDIINCITEKFKGYRHNNLYIYTFDFDKDNYYIIDRTKHIMEKRCIK
ncbi:MAG: B12-binding domain-containing radical SAM protein [Clostridia bacterium]|nr:B12-binding domain-containing radical SAM protein [Clostridia bacterium]